MPRYEVDYLNERMQFRTKVVEAVNEAVLPIKIRELDKELKRIWQVKQLPEKQNGTRNENLNPPADPAQ